MGFYKNIGAEVKVHIVFTEDSMRTTDPGFAPLKNYRRTFILSPVNDRLQPDDDSMVYLIKESPYGYACEKLHMTPIPEGKISGCNGCAFNRFSCCAPTYSCKCNGVQHYNQMDFKVFGSAVDAVNYIKAELGK